MSHAATKTCCRAGTKYLQVVKMKQLQLQTMTTITTRCSITLRQTPFHRHQAPRPTRRILTRLLRSRVIQTSITKIPAMPTAASRRRTTLPTMRRRRARQCRTITTRLNATRTARRKTTTETAGGHRRARGGTVGVLRM